MSAFVAIRAVTAVFAAAVWAGVAAAQAPANDPSTAGGQPNASAARPAATPPEDAAHGLRSGASSFLQSQARELVRSKGFEDVSELVADSHGIWRGTATKANVTYNVSVDYKGTVDARR